MDTQVVRPTKKSIPLNKQVSSASLPSSCTENKQEQKALPTQMPEGGRRNTPAGRLNAKYQTIYRDKFWGNDLPAGGDPREVEPGDILTFYNEGRFTVRVVQSVTHKGVKTELLKDGRFILDAAYTVPFKDFGEVLRLRPSPIYLDEIAQDSTPNPYLSYDPLAEFWG